MYMFFLLDNLGVLGMVIRPMHITLLDKNARYLRVTACPISIEHNSLRHTNIIFVSAL